jgi:hypothetical protein
LTIVSERKVLRTIPGPKIEDFVYRRKYNIKLEREFNSPNIINVAKSNRLRYAGHMIRSAEVLPQKTLFEAKLKGRRNQGRPKAK